MAPEKVSDVTIFSMIEKVESKHGIRWIEKFYLANDGVNSVFVTSASVTVPGVNEAGHSDERTTAIGLGGTSTNGKGPSVELKPNMIWQFSYLEWDYSPGESASGSRASFTRYVAGELKMTDLKSVRRRLLLVQRKK